MTKEQLQTLISDRINKALKKKGITPKQLADLLEIPDPGAYVYYRGKKNWEIETIRRFCIKTKIPWNEIMGGIELF